MKIPKMLFVLAAIFLSTTIATAKITIDPQQYHEQHQAEKKARAQAAKNAPAMPEPAAPVAEKGKKNAAITVQEAQPEVQPETILPKVVVNEMTPEESPTPQAM